jgi:diacylglycerol O-acyltransferase
VGPASRFGVHLLRRRPQRAVNTITTNVPGPQFPLYCLGRRMLEYRPFVPIVHGIRVSTAILSYDGRLSFGITGDGGTAPDVDVVARGTSAAVDELRDRAQARLDPAAPSIRSEVAT